MSQQGGDLALVFCYDDKTGEDSDNEDGPMDLFIKVAPAIASAASFVMQEWIQEDEEDQESASKHMGRPPTQVNAPTDPKDHPDLDKIKFEMEAVKKKC